MYFTLLQSYYMVTLTALILIELVKRDIADLNISVVSFEVIK